MENARVCAIIAETRYVPRKKSFRVLKLKRAHYMICIIRRVYIIIVALVSALAYLRVPFIAESLSRNLLPRVIC